MEYSNPNIPEGINTSKEHPLKEFFILSAGILALVAVVVLILGLLAEMLAPHIPFSMEQELASQFIEQPESTGETQQYLQSLTDKLIQSMDLPENMSITVHYVDDEVVNAFATLGGHIFIHRGLLQKIPHENALSMVLAHEVAHIKHRHPLIAMGRGVVVGLFLATIAGISGDRVTGTIISDAGIVASLGFNRDQEREADLTAIVALEKHYQHVAGANDLFKILLKAQGAHALRMPQFLSTHPLSEDRINYLYETANEYGWQVQGTLSQLPVLGDN